MEDANTIKPNRKMYNQVEVNEHLAGTKPIIKMDKKTKEPDEEGETMLNNQNGVENPTDIHQSLKPKKKYLYIRIFFIQWALLMASGIFGFFFIGDLVQAMVNKELVVLPDSEYFYLWEKPPIEPEMKIYLFNVTNSIEWLSGKDKKIRIQQIGPYVYRETWTKTNITFHSEKSSVSYRMLKKFNFMAQKSSNEDDLIILPNVPLFSAAASMKSANAWTLMGFKAFLNMMDEGSKQLFVTKTVNEVIWGYDDQLSSMASLVMPEEEVGAAGKFGLLMGKNMSLSPWQTVNTGEKNFNLISETVAYNGKTHFKAWSTTECNRIKGSDGSYFRPWLVSSDILSIFVPDLCSSIRLSSTGQEITYDEGQIKTIRFKPHPNTFNYDLEENHCFCSSDGLVPAQKEPEEDDEEAWNDWVQEKDESAILPKTTNNLKCPPNGVMNLGPCKFGAPLYLSWPLFYLADKNLSQAIDGLQQPNEEDHGFRMDIQPTMGLGISVRVRMQMNLKIESSPVLTGLPNSLKGSEFLLPIMWFDDAIEEPPRTILSMLQVALKSGQGVALNALIAVVILCLIELVIFAAYFIWKQSSNKNGKNESSLPWWKNLFNDISAVAKGTK